MYSFDLEAFIRKYLDGDIRNLTDLSLTAMKVSPQKYGFATTDHLDCDDTNLAWEIYNRIWGLRRTPESSPSTGGWVCMNFRGDTMNSFRSLFGREIIVRNDDGIEVQGFRGLRRFGAEDELFNKACKFWYTYHCIGNFIPFPNIKVGKRTINTFRTTWHDYFDVFLENLRPCLLHDSTSPEEDDVSLPKLVAANSFFWDKYRGKDGWERFISEFLLEDYCDEFFRPKRLYSGLWYWKRNVSRSDYIKACHEYIDTASELILSRGKRMMKRVSRTLA